MPTMTPTERSLVISSLNLEQRQAVRELVLEFRETVDSLILDLDDLLVEAAHRDG